MKKIFFLAAAAALTFASCAKESKNGGEEKVVQNVEGFSLRIDAANVNAKVRGTGENAVGASSNVTLSDCYVFIFATDGTILHQQAINGTSTPTLAQVTAPAGTGGVITGSYPENATVLVFGNVPAAVQSTFASKTTMSQVLELTSDISTQTAFATVVLGNEDVNGDSKINLSELAPLVVTGANALATVNIAPMVSRIEMVDIAADKTPDAAGNVVFGFEVTGVFLDKFYDKFTYGGAYTATNSTLFDQAVVSSATPADFTNLVTNFAPYADGQATVALGTTTAGTGPVYGANGAHTAAFVGGATSGPLSTNALGKLPTSGQIWSYNVVPNGVPAIIIRIRALDVRIAATGASASVTYPAASTYYLRISGYELDETAVERMERGMVYRLGGDNPIKFKPENLSNTPVVPADKTLSVAVETVDWQVVEPGVII